jgi:hypothetical protein
MFGSKFNFKHGILSSWQLAISKKAYPTDRTSSHIVNNIPIYALAAHNVLFSTVPIVMPEVPLFQMLYLRDFFVRQRWIRFC